MNSLSGTTTGAFDELLIRNPSFTGGYQNVLSLLSGSSYDDTALQSGLAANSSSISTLSADTTNALATKRVLSLTATRRHR